MKTIIKAQITNEIMEKISQLEVEKNQQKQKVIAEEIIEELYIEHFTPYIAYDDDGDIYIALNCDYGGKGIEESICSYRHDVMISSDDIYIDDESYLEELISEYTDSEKTTIENQKVQKELDYLNHKLMEIWNFERPKCIGNFEKIIEIDEEIKFYEKKIKKLEKILSDDESDAYKFVDFTNKTGKNIGEIQNTKLANFVGVSEGAIRLMKTNDIHRLDCLYLGALCKVNNVTRVDLIKLVENRK